MRNSGRVCRFIKACLGTDNYVGELSTVRQLPEDGVFFHNIQGRTLLYRLSNLKQYNKYDIAIVTENQEDKAWVKGILDGQYETQDAALYFNHCIVVDCAENFKNLDSPVILFIIPQSYNNACIDFVERWLCVVPETARRLEFLLPWDPSQRQSDLTELKGAFPSVVSTLPECTWYIWYIWVITIEVYWQYKVL